MRSEVWKWMSVWRGHRVDLSFPTLLTKWFVSFASLFLHETSLYFFNLASDYSFFAGRKKRRQLQIEKECERRFVNKHVRGASIPICLLVVVKTHLHVTIGKSSIRFCLDHTWGRFSSSSSINQAHLDSRSLNQMSDLWVQMHMLWFYMQLCMNKSRDQRPSLIRCFRNRLDWF